MPIGRAYEIIDWCWTIFALIWLAAAFTNKRTTRKQPKAERLTYLIVLVVGCALIFARKLDLGPLNAYVLPPSPTTAYLGLGFTLAGLLFAIWARFFLGRNWSGFVTVKQDHRLIQRGPYALVRHPIYSGICLALLGGAVAFGEVRGFLGWIIVVIGFRVKWKVEESFMTEQFGAEYTQYKQRVRALVPFVW